MSEDLAALAHQLATTQNPKLDPVQTVRGALQHRLYAMGLFEDHAKTVVAELEKDPVSAAMEGRWSDQASDYPPFLIRLAWIHAQKFTYAWLKKNHPEHWALPAFEQPNANFP